MGKNRSRSKAVRHCRTASATHLGSTPALRTHRDVAHRSDWERFMARYPSVPDAVAAARAGRDVFVVVGVFADARIAVRSSGGPAVIESTTFPGIGLRDLAVTAVLNHPEPDTAHSPVAAALAEHLTAFRRTPAVQVVCEPTDGPVPRFGWQKTFDAEAYTGWEDFWAAHHGAGMDRVFELTGFDGPAGAASPEAFAIFRAHGLHVVRCQVCAQPLTDRHPGWLGVWTAIDPDVGPVCQPQAYRPGLDDLAEYDRIDVALAHRPAIGDQAAATAPATVVRSA